MNNKVIYSLKSPTQYKLNNKILGKYFIILIFIFIASEFGVGGDPLSSIFIFLITLISAFLLLFFEFIRKKYDLILYDNVNTIAFPNDSGNLIELTIDNIYENTQNNWTFLKIDNIKSISVKNLKQAKEPNIYKYLVITTQLFNSSQTISLDEQENNTEEYYVLTLGNIIEVKEVLLMLDEIKKFIATVIDKELKVKVIYKNLEELESTKEDDNYKVIHYYEEENFSIEQLKNKFNNQYKIKNMIK